VAKKKGTNFRTTGYTLEQHEHLQYIQALDIATDKTDNTEIQWWGKHVSNHRVIPAK